MEALVKRNETSVLNFKNLDLNILAGLNLADNSRLIYSQAGNDYNKFLEANNLTVTPDSVNEFLESKNYKGATLNIKRNALKSLLLNQVEIKNNISLRNAIDNTFKSQIKRVKIDSAISKDEYLERWQVNEIKSKANQRLALIIEFAFVTGCRISELINIKLSDLKVNGAVKIDLTGKGNKQRYVFCKVSLYNEINQVFQGVKYLFETRNHSQYNRINLFRDIKNAGEKASYVIHPHTFRHSCAMHLKQAGKDVQYIQKYLGHSRPETTIQNYFHEKPDLEIIDLF